MTPVNELPESLDFCRATIQGKDMQESGMKFKLVSDEKRMEIHPHLESHQGIMLPGTNHTHLSTWRYVRLGWRGSHDYDAEIWRTVCTGFCLEIYASTLSVSNLILTEMPYGTSGK